MNENNSSAYLGKSFWKFFLKSSKNAKVNYYKRNKYYMWESDDYNLVFALLDSNQIFYLSESIYDSLVNFFSITDKEKLVEEFRLVIMDEMGIEIKDIQLF